MNNQMAFWKTIVMGTFLNNIQYLKNIPTLQFILYYDDMKVTNPLGAENGVHKIGQHTYNTHAKCNWCVQILFGKCNSCMQIILT